MTAALRVFPTEAPALLLKGLLRVEASQGTTMTLPPLYLEGLTQHAVRGAEQLNAYKLALIEAILKDARRASPDDPEALRLAVQAALDVATWEMRPSRRSRTDADIPGQE